MNQPLQAVVFDMDDTLYPERTYVLSGFQAVANWLGGQLDMAPAVIYDEIEHLFESGIRGNTFNLMLSHFAIDNADSLVPQMLQVYREHIPDIKPFGEVPTLLEQLHMQYQLGLVSDGYFDVQRRKFAALGLSSRFDAFVFSDEWGRAAWKPSTIPFNAVLERLDVTASAAVYVADNPQKDFFGARAIGMSTIWLRHDQGEYTHLEPPNEHYAPQLTIKNWQQLPGALATLNSKGILL